MILTDEYAGLCVMYQAIHGEEDKKNMPNPAEEEEFKANFEQANEVIDKYDKKNNKLVYILDWLIHLDNAVKKYHEQELKVGKVSIIYFE